MGRTGGRGCLRPGRRTAHCLDLLRSYVLDRSQYMCWPTLLATVLTKSLDVEREEFIVLDEGIDFEAVGRARNPSDDNFRHIGERRRCFAVVD